jgi:ABC-type nitrate/sulfonate/bicarbonate transport system permease component
VTTFTRRSLAGLGSDRLERHRPLVLGLIGMAVLIGLWELLTATLARGNILWPTPSQVVLGMVRDGWGFYWPNIETTTWEAARGFLWGNLLAIAVAIAITFIPLLERPLLQLSVVTYCLPIVAIGPIFAIIFDGESSKVALAAMAVFFPTVVGTVVGLRSGDQTSLDLIHAFGGGGWKKITKVRLWACLPSLFAALRIAGPAAMLGAIIGEDIGGSSGLGVAMINSEQSLDITRTWGIAIAATVVAGLAYAIVALAGRLLMPWARATS